MRICLAAGEDSGDLHGAYLVRELRRLAPTAELVGMAGPRMREAGVAAVVPSESHGLVGFVELFGRLGQFRRDLGVLAAAMNGAQVLVAIDYGGFNARVVARAKRLGLKTVYYIPPKLWAWGKHRRRDLARHLDLVLAVFPFEEPFWAEAGVRTVFVGHPLLDITRPARPRRDVRAALGVGEDAKLVLALPGSRRVEITQLWPPMARALAAIAGARSDCTIIVLPGGGMTAADLERYAPVPATANVITGAAPEYMAAADAAVAASGTATLELALLGTPQLILYKVNQLTWEIGRRLVYVSHLGLPNILAGRPVVPELLQGDVDDRAIATETMRLLDDEPLRRRITAAYEEIRAALTPAGMDGATAPARAARHILEVAGV